MAALRELGQLDVFEEYVRLSQALALDAAGKSREADTALHQARERLQRKAAKLPVAEREAYLSGVPSHRMVMELAKSRVDKK